MTGQDELLHVLDQWSRASFRLESLDRYTAEHESNLLSAFLRGDPVPPDDHGLEEWLGILAEERRQNRQRTRVHAMAGPLTPYLRYEIEWAYPACASSGEDIRLVHNETWQESPFGARPPDFYLLDDATVAVMAYDDVGHWLGGEVITEPGQVARYRVIRDRALRAAVRLSDYLAALRQTPVSPIPFLSTEMRVSA